MGPHEVSVNSQELLGRAKAEARLFTAHGWKPVHLVLGSGALGRQVQQIAQEYGDQQLLKSDSDRPPGKPQSRRSGSSGPKKPILGNSKEGWVQWQQPKQKSLLGQDGESRNGAWNVQQSEQSGSPLQGVHEQSAGQQEWQIGAVCKQPWQGQAGISRSSKEAAGIKCCHSALLRAGKH